MPPPSKHAGRMQVYVKGGGLTEVQIAFFTHAETRQFAESGTARVPSKLRHLTVFAPAAVADPVPPGTMTGGGDGAAVIVTPARQLPPPVQNWMTIRQAKDAGMLPHTWKNPSGAFRTAKNRAKKEGIPGPAGQGHEGLRRPCTTPWSSPTSSSGSQKGRQPDMEASHHHRVVLVAVHLLGGAHARTTTGASACTDSRTDTYGRGLGTGASASAGSVSGTVCKPAGKRTDPTKENTMALPTLTPEQRAAALEKAARGPRRARRGQDPPQARHRRPCPPSSPRARTTT